MLPLYLVTYTIVSPTSSISMDVFKESTVCCVEYARHLMGLITNKKTPDILYYMDENNKASLQLIVSVSFGRSKAEHLWPIAEALGQLMMARLPGAKVQMETNTYTF